jgi:hypothetical protein
MIIVVSNASPLILLSGVGHFERLRDLFGEVRITPQVFDEVAVRGKGRPGAAEVGASPFIRIQEVVESRKVRDLRDQAQVAEGEASTIILAAETKADLVLIDEKAARQAAKALGLTVAGTMRVLELAFERKQLADLRGTYASLKAGGARITPALLNASLTRFGLPPLG